MVLGGGGAHYLCTVCRVSTNTWFRNILFRTSNNLAVKETLAAVKYTVEPKEWECSWQP